MNGSMLPAFQFITRKFLDDLPELCRLIDEGLPCAGNRGEVGNSELHIDYIYAFHADGKVEIRAEIKQKGDQFEAQLG